MSYVDGYVLLVPTKNLDAYRAMSQLAGKVWMKYGALQYVECVADDMEDKGFCATFPQTLNAAPDETVVFSFVVYPSRAVRDHVNEKVMSDPELKASCDPENMPFDCKRMSFGGFMPIVELSVAQELA